VLYEIPENNVSHPKIYIYFLALILISGYQNPLDTPHDLNVEKAIQPTQVKTFEYKEVTGTE
jgi:hypothetical protein